MRVRILQRVLMALDWEAFNKHQAKVVKVYECRFCEQFHVGHVKVRPALWREVKRQRRQNNA